MIAGVDEGVPVRLVKALTDVGCRVVRFPNDWKGLKNGELLARIRRSGYEGLVTCDKNIRHQQDLPRSGLAVIILPRQRFEELKPTAQAIANALEQAQPGDVLMLDPDGRVALG